MAASKISDQALCNDLERTLPPVSFELEMRSREILTPEPCDLKSGAFCLATWMLSYWVME